MKVTYSFSVLRYVHDPVTGEFVNIGVALYAKDARYFDAMCATNYGRISRMFAKIDGDRFRQIARYIQDRIHELGNELSSKLQFESFAKIETLLSGVLPPDDSAFQFSQVGVGVTNDLPKTLQDLFERLVQKYASHLEPPSRDDEDVWRVFREPLERRNVADRLVPKKIVAPDFDYEFKHSWKNKVWHMYEPISFDMVDPNSILDKANRWVGRSVNLKDSNEKFKMHILLGAPQNSALGNTFVKATNILHKMPIDLEFIKENEAEDFADEVATEIKSHSEG